MPRPKSDAWQVGYEWATDHVAHATDLTAYAEANGIEFGTPAYETFLEGVAAGNDNLAEY